MSRRSKLGVPVAPATLSSRADSRWARRGRADSKRYGQLLDFTPTHSLLLAVDECRRGQHNVNAWLINEVEPERIGNLRIRVKMDADRERLKSLKASRVESQRLRARIAADIARLEYQLINSQAQYDSNLAKGLAKIQIAEQAMGTWDKYYRQIAAVYTRARTNSKDSNTASVEAEIPAMESIDLVVIDDFDELAGKRKAK